MGRRNDIPERWEQYSPCGRPIPETPFVAFKVPLSQRLQSRYDETYPSFSEGTEEKHVWTVKALEERLPNVDLILDLTATDRYYNPNQLSRRIRHDKIKTKGHVVPDHQVVRRFFWAVDKILSEKKDALIGVHCTHGVNRTGYLICRYLIEKMDWAPQKAIDEFNLHRGHEIERKNYLDDLKLGKWASQEQSESQGSNPGNSQFERRDGYHQQWSDRRPRYYQSRFSSWSNSDNRNWRNHRNDDYHYENYYNNSGSYRHQRAWSNRNHNQRRYNDNPYHRDEFNRKRE